MVDQIRGQSTAQPLAVITQQTPINLDVVNDFGALLKDLLGNTAIARVDQRSAGQSGAQTAVTHQLPWVSLAQSLRYLSVRARPQFAPSLPSSQPGALFATAQAGAAQASAARPQPVAASVVSPTPFSAAPTGVAGLGGRASGALPLVDYPHPPADNGRGVHWIPTTRQSPEVVDSFVQRLKQLDMKWVTFLNEPGDLTGNEYLVDRLTESGIMPVMRIYTDAGTAIQQDIKPLVAHYRQLGVSYFQLYNEPNLRVENQGQAPDADRFLDQLIPAARQVVEAGGLPGLGALSPQGDADDLVFLRQMLEGMKARGATDVLQRSWISVHNYGQDHLRVRQYDQVVRDTLGRSLPLIGTEGGIFPGGGVTEADQVRIVTDAYQYLQDREPYYFAYSLWVLANQAADGRDANWEPQALYRTDGPSALAKALENQI